VCAGTVKTITGVKLICLFTQINKKLVAEGKGKKVLLFCGPSNKSVDLVASMYLTNALYFARALKKTFNRIVLLVACSKIFKLVSR
jgi:hypothetical protein